MDLQTKLVNAGYAQAHVSPETRSLPAWANWRDEVFSIGTDPIVMVYNTRKLDAARAPRTRRELLSLRQAPDQPLAGKISTYDVQGSGIGYLAATQDTRLDSMAGALLAALGARAARRPVKVALARPLIANNTTHRPATIQRIRIGTTQDGKITAIAHESWSGDLPDGKPEEAVQQTRLLYAGANRLTALNLVELDLPEDGRSAGPGSR
ncbi:hypothetical protein G6F68_014177 [Rhizopus microsporus]|nr:hypothetical protein G6F68_014177 [Rhizopus microsporus]